MQIYIIRHGETDFNRQGRIQGRVDNPLNENGKAELIEEDLLFYDSTLAVNPYKS